MWRRIPWDCWGASSFRCCAWRGSSVHLPASPSPRLQRLVGQRPPLSLGRETRPVRRGPALPPAPSRRVSAKDASRAGSDGGLRGFSGPTELASRRGRLPAPPAAAARRGLPSLRTSVGLFPAPPLALCFPNFLFFQGSVRSGAVCVCAKDPSRGAAWGQLRENVDLTPGAARRGLPLGWKRRRRRRPSRRTRGAEAPCPAGEPQRCLPRGLGGGRAAHGRPRPSPAGFAAALCASPLSAPAPDGPPPGRARRPRYEDQ